MSYEISPGIAEDALAAWLKNAAEKYGTFNDGRVNYKHADTAPIVMCTVRYKDELLLVKRARRLGDAAGYWSVITGFIDEVKSVKEQAIQELREELKLGAKPGQISVGSSYTLKNSVEKRTYIVFPCRVDVQEKPAIILDKEHTDYVWVHRDNLLGYHVLDDLPYAIDAALKT